MAKAISLDLRRRVCAAISEGLSCREAAARFKVSASSAIRWQAQMRASGDIAPLRNGGDCVTVVIVSPAGLRRKRSSFFAKSRSAAISRWLNCRKNLRRTEPGSASGRFGGSSTAAKSHIKKDSACGRAATRRRSGCTR